MVTSAKSEAGTLRRAVTRFFRWSLVAILRLFPGRFRGSYGAEMLELFELRCADAWNRRGFVAALRLWIRTVPDLCITAAAEANQSSFEARTRLFEPSPGRHRGDGPVMNLAYDVRHAVRAFARRPAFATLVVATLALGIGANTAIFSVVSGVLLSPMPYEEPEQLMAVWGRFDPISGFDYPRFPLAGPEWLDYRAQSRAMDDVAIYWAGGVTITGGDGDPERVTAGRVSFNTFEILGAEPAMGRMFDGDEDQIDAPVAVLEHGFWQSRFGGDPGIVGKTVIVDGAAREVIGVMPEGFRFIRDARLWLPTELGPDNPGHRQSHYMLGFGRLADGASLEQAEAELDTLMAGWADEYPEIHTGHYLFVNPMLDDQIGSVRPALLLLLAASGVVLLMVCANVASVLLARGEERLKEVAIRTAMGAGRWQIARLMLTESALLSIMGGATGVGMAYYGVSALMAMNAGSVPRAELVTVDGTVLGFAALTTLITAALFGLFPALYGARSDARATLQDGPRGASASRSRLWFRRGLVIAEVALSFLLVLGAGLMLRSFDELLRVDPGYQTDRRLVATISLPEAAYEEPERVHAFYDALTARVGGMSGVESVAAAANLPLSSSPGVWDFRIEGEPVPGEGQQAWNAAMVPVRPGFFETMGTELLRGRLFQPSDNRDSMLVSVISEGMAEKFFPGEDPLGRRISIAGTGEPEDLPWMTIVGIVADMRYQGLDTDPRPAYYTVHKQAPRSAFESVFRTLTVVVKTEADPMALAPSFRDLVGELDDQLPIIGLQTMDELVATSVARPRFTTTLLGVFAAVAMLLGASGIYGVLAFSVAQRTREIGIRKALGAPSKRVATMIVAQGMALVAVGLAIGAVASYWATQALGDLLFNVSPNDTATYAGVAFVLCAVALAACCVPTLRALRVDPLESMRAE